jgi:predicted nucleotidyltransferase
MDEAVVREELQRIGRGIATLLGENFVGFYITGSFAMGAWNPQRSDLDFLVIMKHPATSDEDAALATFHTALATTEIGKRLEGEYIDRETLRQKQFHTPVGTVLEGVYCPNSPCLLSADNVLCLIQYGQCVLGEPLEHLSLTVTPQELSQAVYQMLLEDREELEAAPPVETVLSLLMNSLRCIYTLRTGLLPTKSAAVAFNRDLLSDDLSTHLTKFQQGLVPAVMLPHSEVRAIIEYGLSLRWREDVGNFHRIEKRANEER